MKINKTGIKYTILSEIQLEELNYILEEEILGDSCNDETYCEVIETKESKNFSWCGIQKTINIDTLINNLKKLKKDGANHVEIIYHTDHVGYYLYGYKMELATEDDIKEKLKRDSEIEKFGAEEAIKELYSQIEKLKKEISENDGI
jgi:hypothetical protein